MILEDEDSLLCDMAETYGIMDVESLPVLLYARLACGLRPTSRIKTKLYGEHYSDEVVMLAVLIDRITSAFWTGEQDPPSIYNELFGPKEKPSEKNGRRIFASPEDFEREWERN